MKQKWPQYPLIVPKAGSFLFRGGRIGCLLVHGYTASAEEMLPLGEFLVKQGYTVLGVRLAGHGTHPADLSRIRLPGLAEFHPGWIFYAKRNDR